MHLLQVANVGNICGGTAACAWSVTRALPEVRHSIAFLSAVTAETQRQFAGCRLLSAARVTGRQLRELDPDVVLLHNTPPGRFDEHVAIPTILYRHSLGERAAAAVSVCCSQWLADRVADDAPVLYQGVPQACRPQAMGERSLRERPVVGRICTPHAHKWPGGIVPFYAALAAQHPQVDWEFVGCPPSLTAQLERACCGRVRFHTAGWNSRRHYWCWDAMLYHHPTLSESFGRTAAEAMRCGCIPIVDDRGGFREQVAPECGFLCSTLDHFSAALDSLQYWTLRRCYARKAKAHADRHFSLDTFSRRLRELLNSLDRLAWARPAA